MPTKKKTKKKPVRKKTVKKKTKKKAGVKVKKHPGTTFRAKPRPKLIGDSYQADEKDLRKLKRIAKRHGKSKAEILRWATKIALLAYEAKEQGKRKLSISLKTEAA